VLGALNSVGAPDAPEQLDLRGALIHLIRELLAPVTPDDDSVWSIALAIADSLSPGVEDMEELTHYLREVATWRHDGVPLDFVLASLLEGQVDSSSLSPERRAVLPETNGVTLQESLCAIFVPAFDFPDAQTAWEAFEEPLHERELPELQQALEAFLQNVR
jgi:hypothetical protein